MAVSELLRRAMRFASMPLRTFSIPIDVCDSLSYIIAGFLAPVQVVGRRRTTVVVRRHARDRDADSQPCVKQGP